MKMPNNKARILAIIQIILSCIILALGAIILFNKNIVILSKIKFNNIIISLLILLNLLSSYIEFKINKNAAKAVFYIAIALIMIGFLFVGTHIFK